MRKLYKGLVALLVLGSVCVQNAYADYNAMETALESTITSAAGIVSSLAIAGLAIFAVIWGIRKFKQAVKAGA